MFRSCLRPLTFVLVVAEKQGFAGGCQILVNKYTFGNTDFRLTRIALTVTLKNRDPQVLTMIEDPFREFGIRSLQQLLWAVGVITRSQECYSQRRLGRNDNVCNLRPTAYTRVNMNRPFELTPSLGWAVHDKYLTQATFPAQTSFAVVFILVSYPRSQTFPLLHGPIL
jgi:hypothetical protein